MLLSCISLAGCHPQGNHNISSVRSESLNETPSCESLSTILRQSIGSAHRSHEPNDALRETAAIANGASAACSDNSIIWYYLIRLASKGYLSFPLRHGPNSFTNLGELVQKASSKFPDSAEIARELYKLTGERNPNRGTSSTYGRDAVNIVAEASRLLAVRETGKSKTLGHSNCQQVIGMLNGVSDLGVIPGGLSILAQAQYDCGDYDGAALTSSQTESVPSLMAEPTTVSDLRENQRIMFAIRGAAETKLGHADVATVFRNASKEDASPSAIQTALTYDYQDDGPAESDNEDSDSAATSNLQPSLNQWFGNNPAFMLVSAEDRGLPSAFDRYLIFDPGRTDEPTSQDIADDECQDKFDAQQDKLTASLSELSELMRNATISNIGRSPSLLKPGSSLLGNALIGTLSIYNRGEKEPSGTILAQGGPPFRCRENRQHRFSYSFPNSDKVPYYLLGEPSVYARPESSWLGSRIAWNSPLSVRGKPPHFSIVKVVGDDGSVETKWKNDGGQGVIYFLKDGQWINATGIDNGTSTWYQICNEKWNPQKYPGVGFLTRIPLCEEWRRQRAKARKKRSAIDPRLINLEENLKREIRDQEVVLNYFVDPDTARIDTLYKGNDFGKIATRINYPNGKSTHMYIHATRNGERAAESLAVLLNKRGQISAIHDMIDQLIEGTFAYSHACIHVLPIDRDTWIAEGILSAGTPIKVKKYTVVKKLAAK